jgi:hypothetical protein
MSVIETSGGFGRLEKLERAAKKYEVCYRFKITAGISEMPDFSKVAARENSEGMVELMGGGQSPEGAYRLYTDDQILQVQNLGMGTRCILS